MSKRKANKAVRFETKRKTKRKDVLKEKKK